MRQNSIDQVRVTGISNFEASIGDQKQSQQTEFWDFNDRAEFKTSG